MIKIPKGSSSQSMASGGVGGGHGEELSYLCGGGGHYEFNHSSVHKLDSEILRGREHTGGKVDLEGIGSKYGRGELYEISK